MQRKTSGEYAASRSVTRVTVSILFAFLYCLSVCVCLCMCVFNGKHEITLIIIKLLPLEK